MNIEKIQYQKNITLSKHDALIIVDMQNDFMPGGALPVEEGDQIIDSIIKVARIFKENNGLIVLTQDWHPEDHIAFKWVEGNPLEEGSKFYAEQLVMGKAKQYNGTISKIIPYRKIVIKFCFPISLVSPKIEWLLEPKNSTTVFSAITHMRLGKLFSKLFKKKMAALCEVHNKHTWAEAENLKKIMEK